MPNSLKIGDTDKPRPPGFEKLAGWFKADDVALLFGIGWECPAHAGRSSAPGMKHVKFVLAT